MLRISLFTLLIISFALQCGNGRCSITADQERADELVKSIEEKNAVIIGDVKSNLDLPISIPEKQGMSSSILAQLSTLLNEDVPSVRSILIAKNGNIVYEYYRKGISKYNLNAVNSVTKSIVSALIGVAIQSGKIAGVKQKISDYFPEVLTSDVDERVKEITIEDLLTMSSGFDHDDMKWFGCIYDYRCNSLSGGETTAIALKRKISSRPGSRFNYDSLGSTVLSDLVGRAAGIPTEKLAEEALFRPLGISKYAWQKNPEGVPRGGTGLFLSSRDLLKIGQLYLNSGEFNGVRILPEDFARESVLPKAPIPSLPNSAQNASNGYGYHWWIPLSEGHPYSARGAGSQEISIYKALNLILVITTSEVIFSASPSSATSVQKDVDWIKHEFILPAAGYQVP